MDDAERLIEIRFQMQRFASEIEDQKRIERDIHLELNKRLEGVEEFIYQGNGHDPATVRLSRVESFVEVAEKFIMRHEAEHKTVDETLRGIGLTIATAKTWIAAAIFFSSVVGTIAGFLLNLYFSGKP